jgi:hypothetical protein
MEAWTVEDVALVTEALVRLVEVTQALLFFACINLGWMCGRAFIKRDMRL